MIWLFCEKAKRQRMKEVARGNSKTKIRGALRSAGSVLVLSSPLCLAESRTRRLALHELHLPEGLGAARPASGVWGRARHMKKGDTEY